MTTTQRLDLAITVSWRRKGRRKNSSHFWNFYSIFTINSRYNGLIHMTWRHTIFFHEYKKIYISKEWKEWFILTQADVPETKETKQKKRVLFLAPRTLRQRQSLVGSFTVVLLSCSCHNSNNHVFIKCAASPTSVPTWGKKKETKREKK